MTHRKLPVPRVSPTFMLAKRFASFRETMASFVAGLNIRPSTIFTPGRISMPMGAMPRTCTFENVFPSARGMLISVSSSGET